MATLKITLFFEGRGRGWTESYWRPGAGGDHEAQEEATMSLTTARAQLLGRECWIKAYRISTEGTGPDALLKYVDIRHKAKANTPLGEAGLAPTAAQPDVGLLVRCSNIGRTKHKFIFLRGIWDLVENEHGKYTPTVEWKAAFAKYANILHDSDFGWFGVQSKIKSRLLSAVRDPQDRVTFTFADDMVALDQVGKRARVRISGVNNGTSSLNRTHVVEVVSRKVLKTEYTTAVGENVVGGFGATQVLDYIDIKHVDDQKIITREAGAPLLESVGRRKARQRS